MPDVFISYSRKDRPFVRQLHDSLRAKQRDVWIDWEDIEYAEDWWQKICAGIDSVDTFVFVITPDSVCSKVCRDEIDYAARQNKRIVPILRVEVADEVDRAQMHPNILRHNWLPFTDHDTFDASFADLIKTIEADPDYVHAHTRLLLRAREWSDAGRRKSLLLRDADLKAAEAWLTEGVAKDPRPTTLHAEYIAASRKAERRRMGIFVVTSTILVILAGVLALLFYLLSLQSTNRGRAAIFNAATAVYNENVANSIALAAQARLELEGGYRERAPLLALAALENYPYTWQAERALGETVRESRASLLLAVGADGGANDAAWSPDGTTIATVNSRTIHLWDVATGERIRTLEAVGDAVTHIAWSPDGETLLTTDLQGMARLYDAESGELTFEKDVSFGTGALSMPAWSPDGTRFLTAGDGIAVWDSQTGEVLQRLRGHTDVVWGAAWSPDGEQIVSASQDGSMIVWDVESGEGSDPIQMMDPISAVDWSPLGRIIAVGAGRTIYLWDTETQTVTALLNGHGAPINDVEYSHDGTELASTALDNTMRVWNLDWNTEEITLRGHSSNMGRVHWSPDDSRILALAPYRSLHANQDNDIRVWRVRDNPLRHADGFNLLAWSPDGARLVTNSYRRSGMHVWDTRTGEELPYAAPDNFTTWPMMQQGAWMPDGARIVSAGGAAIFMWNAGDGTQQWSQLIDEVGVSALAVSPDGSQIAVGGVDGTVYVVDADSGEILRQARSEYPSSLAWSPDSTRLLVASGSGLRVWEVEGGELPVEPTLPGPEIEAAAWSHNGQWIATGDSSGLVRLWDSGLREQLRVLIGHTDFITSIDFSPNDQRIATASADGSARVWDIESGEELTALIGHSDIVWKALWSPDGTQIATTSADDTTRLWPAWQTTGDLIAYARACCVVRELTDVERQRFGLLPPLAMPTLTVPESTGTAET